MIYIKSLKLITYDTEEYIINEDHRTYINSWYPFRLFPQKDLKYIDFSPITIFYGGNGSGKSTLLNIIAEKTNAKRNQPVNKGETFTKYVGFCSIDMEINKPDAIKIVTSDDVFDYLLDIRSINNHIDKSRSELFSEYLDYKYNNRSFNIYDYESLKNSSQAKKMTKTGYMRERLTKNQIIEQSNGESALMFFEKEILENSVYILDEPENSLSAESQIKLVKFIEDSARFYNCQFIISTHSPFLLSLKNALIYDLDSIPATTKKWVDLKNVRIYYDFFNEHKEEF